MAPLLVALVLIDWWMTGGVGCVQEIERPSWVQARAKPRAKRARSSAYRFIGFLWGKRKWSGSRLVCRSPCRPPSSPDRAACAHPTKTGRSRGPDHQDRPLPGPNRYQVASLTNGLTVEEASARVMAFS